MKAQETRAGGPNYSGLERWNKAPEPDSSDIIWSRIFSDEVLTRAITPLFYSLQAHLFTYSYDFTCRLYGYKVLLPLRMTRFHKNRAYFSTKYLRELVLYSPRSLRDDEALKFFAPEQKDELREADFRGLGKLWGEVRLATVHRRYSLTKCYKYFYKKWVPELMRRVEELDQLDFDDASREELEEYYRGMDRLLKEHCEPIVPGVMFHTAGLITVLNLLVTRWCQDDSFVGKLLSGIPGNWTVEGNEATWRLADRIGKDAKVRKLFENGSPEEVLQKLQETPEGQEFLPEFEEFRAKYDFRGAEDREVSFPRWGDDPKLLISILKVFLQGGEDMEPKAVEEDAKQRREQAEAEVLRRARSQRWGFIKRPVLNWVMKYAQNYSLFRENQRYLADRVFYGQRKAFLGIAERLVDMGVLDDVEEIWFLSKEEAVDALWGRMVAGEAQELIAPRREEYAVYSEAQPPSFVRGEGVEEFEGEADAVVERRQAEEQAGGMLRGVAASPGQIKGTARVVRTLSELDRVEAGDIMITNSTDPAWTPAFLLIKGLVLETGGILAHGTVLCREYGLPCVSSVAKATELVPDGEPIVLDGNSGTVQMEV